jgi:hypothetical protein
MGNGREWRKCGKREEVGGGKGVERDRGMGNRDLEGTSLSSSSFSRWSSWRSSVVDIAEDVLRIGL